MINKKLYFILLEYENIVFTSHLQILFNSSRSKQVFRGLYYLLKETVPLKKLNIFIENKTLNMDHGFYPNFLNVLFMILPKPS